MRCAKSYQDIESPDEYKDNSDYFEEFIERYIEKWGEQTDEDYDIIHLYWYTIVTDYLDEGILDISVNEMRESLVWYFKRIAEQRLKDIKVSQEQYRKQKEINKELVDENESLKEHIAELEKSCDETQELLDKQIEATYKLVEENAGLKAGRPQWHKVADGDLPNTEREVLIFMWGSYYLGHYKQYDGEDRSWHFEDFDEESEQVIAWCEIPTFKE